MTEKGGLRPAPKFCHNPQYHLKLLEPDIPDSGAVDVTLVLRRTDAAPPPPSKRNAGKKLPPVPTIGLVVRKAPAPEEEGGNKRRSKAPKTNALGEPKPTKESTLKKKPKRPGDDGFGGWGDDLASPFGDDAQEAKMYRRPRRNLFRLGLSVSSD